jgi:hypothetical protein
MDRFVTRCVWCRDLAKPLILLRDEGLPHQDPRHGLTYAHAWIGRCAGCGKAQLETFSHDCFSYDPDDVGDLYGWFSLDPPDADRLVELIQLQCPRPGVTSCDCEIHRSLRESLRHLPMHTRSLKPHPRYQDASEVRDEVVAVKIETIREGRVPVLLARGGA